MNNRELTKKEISILRLAVDTALNITRLVGVQTSAIEDLMILSSIIWDADEVTING